ncbi:hypothetical protein POM88_019101 [Heracleum sosnowskyi]|uniref:Cation efflux protein transmembrane domain-containing protein n=1 Tax=Heracleum sosnowskyi TaxID=360622 RepID=A0AAD8ITI8_9APIA|nr:hypothetical protein POM88_019101 [Heracleum sosnowskyi]
MNTAGDIMEIYEDHENHQERTAVLKNPCTFFDENTTLKEENVHLNARKKVIIALVLSLIFMIIEIIGGLIANSLAILTDAAHMSSNIAAFGISLFPVWAVGDAYSEAFLWLPVD